MGQLREAVENGAGTPLGALRPRADRAATVLAATIVLASPRSEKHFLEWLFGSKQEETRLKEDERHFFGKGGTKANNDRIDYMAYGMRWAGLPSQLLLAFSRLFHDSLATSDILLMGGGPFPFPEVENLFMTLFLGDAESLDTSFALMSRTVLSFSRSSLQQRTR